MVWLLMSAVAKGRVGLKIVSGYGGIKLVNCLTDKELCDFRVVKRVTKVPSIFGTFCQISGIS
jgi:hypothetical protein